MCFLKSAYRGYYQVLYIFLTRNHYVVRHRNLFSCWLRDLCLGGFREGKWRRRRRSLKRMSDIHFPLRERGASGQSLSAVGGCVHTWQECGVFRASSRVCLVSFPLLHTAYLLKLATSCSRLLGFWLRFHRKKSMLNAVPPPPPPLPPRGSESASDPWRSSQSRSRWGFNAESERRWGGSHISQRATRVEASGSEQRSCSAFFFLYFFPPDSLTLPSSHVSSPWWEWMEGD